MTRLVRQYLVTIDEPAPGHTSDPDACASTLADLIRGAIDEPPDVIVSVEPAGSRPISDAPRDGTEFLVQIGDQVDVGRFITAKSGGRTVQAVVLNIAPMPINPSNCVGWWPLPKAK